MRIEDPSKGAMSDAQRKVAEESASGKRGHLPAPLRAWLHSPEFGNRAQRLGEYLRYDTSLPPRLSELAILVTARFWTAHYEWYAHKREALKAGISATIVDAIANRATPDFDDAKDSAVYAYTRTLLTSGRVDDEVHAQAVKQIGTTGTVELVGIIGYYSLVAMTLNAFEIDLPDGVTPELKP
jgi:4-carboxymuconolactone decarboxylase